MTDNIRDRIKPGDRVRLRFGGIVKAKTKNGFMFLGDIVTGNWNEAGMFSGPDETDFDIVEILPRPLTDAERLAKIADILDKTTDYFDVTKIRELARPPARLDPGREVTQSEWSTAYWGTRMSEREAVTAIVRARLAEAEAQRHE